MHTNLLSTYLNDHLAGSVFAIDLLEHCKSKHTNAGLAASLDQIHTEIQEDQAMLKEIMARLGVKESAVKKAGAWLSEKAGHLSLSGSEPRQVSFIRLQELEALLVGIRGKLALWEVLEAIFVSEQKLMDMDWAELKRRATSQLQSINSLRIQAAREAFMNDSPATGS